MKIPEIFDLLTMAGKALSAHRGTTRENIAAVDAQKHIKEARLILAPHIATPYAKEAQDNGKTDGQG